MFNRIKSFLERNGDSYSVTLTNEEWYEVKKALQSDIKRNEEEVPALAAAHPILNAPGSVVDRAKHSIAIRRAALKKIPG